MFSIIKSPNDTTKLQQDLGNVQRWSCKWLLKLNSTKHKVMHTGRSLGESYHMCDLSTPGSYVDIEEVTSGKDLGVWTTSNLDSSLQCQKAASARMRMLGMIKRAFQVMSKDLFLFLYKTYVQPHLEYCVQIWSQYLAKDIDLLERVQIWGLANLSYMYEFRLKSLGLYSLHCHHQWEDLIETFKILKGCYNVNCEKLFTRSIIHYTRGHNLKLFKQQSRLNLRLNFFT